jgi:hypothetical protein
MVKVVDAVCKMVCRVAVSQPRTNRVHIYMPPTIWLAIKAYLLEEKKDKKMKIYNDNDLTVTTIKRGVFVTPDKRIELATIERQAEIHHDVDRMIAYTREHIAIIQCMFGLYFGIGARIHHPKSTTELEKINNKRARMTTMATRDTSSSTLNNKNVRYQPIYEEHNKNLLHPKYLLHLSCMISALIL